MVPNTLFSAKSPLTYLPETALEVLCCCILTNALKLIQASTQKLLL